MMEPPPTRVDVAADYGTFFNLGEMNEREIVGGEMRGVFWSQRFFLWLMLIEICLGG